MWRVGLLAGMGTLRVPLRMATGEAILWVVDALRVLWRFFWAGYFALLGLKVALPETGNATRCL